MLRGYLLCTTPVQGSKIARLTFRFSGRSAHARCRQPAIPACLLLSIPPSDLATLSDASYSPSVRLCRSLGSELSCGIKHFFFVVLRVCAMTTHHASNVRRRQIEPADLAMVAQVLAKGFPRHNIGYWESPENTWRDETSRGVSQVWVRIGDRYGNSRRFVVDCDTRSGHRAGGRSLQRIELVRLSRISSASAAVSSASITAQGNQFYQRLACTKYNIYNCGTGFSQM